MLSNACRGIVKSYQEEIDKLTKRCKTSDGLVLDLYKTLYELPDPAPLISSAAEHVENMAGQVEHLLKGMDELQNEIEILRRSNQNDANNEIERLHRLLNDANQRNSNLESQLQEKSFKNQFQDKAYMSKDEKEELIELRREIAEYEVEFKTLKNQDITIKKLNAKIEELMESKEEELQNELKYVSCFFIIYNAV